MQSIDIFGIGLIVVLFISIFISLIYFIYYVKSRRVKMFCLIAFFGLFLFCVFLCIAILRDYNPDLVFPIVNYIGKYMNSIVFFALICILGLPIGMILHTNNIRKSKRNEIHQIGQ